MHKPGNVLVGLSIVPALPVLMFGALGVINGMGHPSAAWGWMAVSTLFGIAGCVGLVLAYFSAGSKIVITALISCGYLALGVAIMGVNLAYREQQTLLPAGVMGQPFPLVQLIVLLWMLAWPICAGIVAIRDQWRDRS